MPFSFRSRSLSPDSRRRPRLKVLSAFAAALLAFGCTASTQKPVGIGNDVNELKRSPCACFSYPQKPGIPDWMQSPPRA